MAALWSTVTAGAARLAAAQVSYVLAALALYVFSVFVTGVRWRGFLRALGGDVSVLQAGLATLGGIAVGNVTPSRFGSDPCRVALVRLTGQVTWAQVTLAAAWDRLSEVPAVALLVVMSAFAVGEVDFPWRRAALAIALAAALIAAGVSIHRLRRSRGSLRSWIASLKLDRVSPTVLAAGVGYSTLLWLLDVLRLSSAALALGVHLSPSQTATLAVSTIVGGLVPTVGGLAVVEGGLVAALMAFGVDVPTAVAVTAVERAISYGFSTVAGGLVAVMMGGRSLWSLATRRRADAA